MNEEKQIDQPDQDKNLSRHTQSKNKRHISQKTFISSLVLVAVVAFIGGTRSDQIYMAISPMLGIKTDNTILETDVLQQAYKDLRTDFDGEINRDQLADGAIRGMVATAGDRYTVFMDKKEATDFNKDLNGEISGVGAEIGVRNNQPTVLRVLDESPASKAGLKSGDVFLSVNDKDVKGKDASTVANLVRGEAGTTVKLKMQRAETSLDFSITRAKVSDPSVRASVEDGIGVIKLSRFDNQTGELAAKAANDFKAKNVKGVILDLRDNGGGYLDAAKDVAGLWLDNKEVVSEKARGKLVDRVMSSSGQDILKGVKTVVLVNGGSASASEIVAGALKDYKVATLVGDKTYGKGSVQKVIDLPDGRILKVTVARWYTPNGKNITSEGIKPDMEIKLTSEDTNIGKDTQMAQAKGLF